jgi:hypothetical protein
VQEEVAVKLSERLLKRLREQGIVPAGGEVRVERTDASRSQKEYGAWTWAAYWGEGMRQDQCAGSKWTMAQCLSAPRLEVHRHRETGEVSVIPCDGDGKLWFGGKR